MCLSLGLSLCLCPRRGCLLLFGGFLLGSNCLRDSLLGLFRLLLPFGELGCCTLRLLLPLALLFGMRGLSPPRLHLLLLERGGVSLLLSLHIQMIRYLRHGGLALCGLLHGRRCILLRAPLPFRLLCLRVPSPRSLCFSLPLLPLQLPLGFEFVLLFLMPPQDLRLFAFRLRGLSLGLPLGLFQHHPQLPLLPLLKCLCILLLRLERS
mmetsp:Transcript_109659/g.318663  ORF Transcript_109659/g.318663 Transcript_109659/m.318663 type:complete len:208 (-) Transcript_109659:329-952(-)